MIVLQTGSIKNRPSLEATAIRGPWEVPAQGCCLAPAATEADAGRIGGAAHHGSMAAVLPAGMPGAPGACFRGAGVRVRARGGSTSGTRP